MKRIFVAFGSLIFLTTTLMAGEKLVYSVAYEDPGRFPRSARTEFYSIEPETKNTKLVFSDVSARFPGVNAYLILEPIRRMGGEPDQTITSVGQRIFAPGVEKGQQPGGWYAKPAAIYEISADGSNTFRKIFDLQESVNLKKLFINASGTKIGYITYVQAKLSVFIHDTKTGSLLHKIEMSKIALDCFARNIGWLPDGERLFFTLETGDEHVTSKASYKRVGSYVMKEGGTDLVRVPPSLLTSQRKGYSIDPTIPPAMLAGLPDGRYLFSEHQWEQNNASRSASTFLFLVDPASKSRMECPVTGSQNLYWFLVSRSGRYLAFTENNRQNEPEQVWIRNLESGAEIKLFTFPTVSLRPPYLGLIGWIEE